MIPDDELKMVLPPPIPIKNGGTNRIELDEIPKQSGLGIDSANLTQRMQAFGYTQETMQFMLEPMLRELRDPLGSMGNDAALAVMSEKLRMLYDYFSAVRSGY